MPASLTCYGAVGEIGGNKLLLEDKDTKVFLDFGTCFSEGSDYFDAGIEPRHVNGAGDLFEFGLLPEIPGLYSKRALQNTSLKYVEPEIDAILLSHYHWDHMGRIGFLDPSVPVYAGETTALIHEAASESTYSPLDDHIVKTFRTGDRLRIGSLEVVPIHVDHSIPGAYGFVVYTSDGALAYTGDFRFHGPLGSMTEEFASEALKANPSLLVTEGTRVAPRDIRQDLSEEAVLQETVKVLGRSKKLAFSSFRGNDTDRVNTFHKAAQKTERQLVVSMKTATLLEKLQKDRHLKVPRVGKDVLVYVRRKGSGKIDDRDYYKWERPFLDHGMTATDVHDRQGEVFLHLDIWNFPEIIDIKPEKGGVYVHSSSEAFNEEGEREEGVIKNWVDHVGFSYHQIHASGHSPLEGVRRLVHSVGAEKVVPIHTEHPELFRSFKGRCMIPKKGRKISL